MSQALTYDSLVQDVKSYLDRGASTDIEVQARIPQFINDAERELAKSLDLQEFDEVLTFKFTAGLSVYDKPERWRRTQSIRYGDNLAGATTNQESKPIFARSYEYCRMVWPDGNLLDKPRYYADYDKGHWLITPTPDANYPVEVIIKAMPQLLDTANQTNFLTEMYPQILRLTALKNAAIFLKNDEAIALYKAELASLVGPAQDENLKKIVDRAATRQSP